MKIGGIGWRSWPMIMAAFAVCACTSTGGNSPFRRPAPPAGFTWKEIPDVKAAFLMPEGWHYTEAVKGKTFGFYMTREEIVDGGNFDTGLSVNVIRGDGSTDAVDGARRFVERMIERNEELDRWEIETGKFKGFGCRTRNAAPLGDAMYITHALAMGNPSTNTVYFMWFESREETWPEAWETGEKLFDQFVLDDEI